MDRRVSALDLDREGYVIASSINATVLRMKPSHSDEVRLFPEEHPNTAFRGCNMVRLFFFFFITQVWR